MNRVVILQPSYIPWRGYFHQIQKADTFVFLDDVQYDSRGWRHRNRFKTREGTRWLSIPVLHKGSQTEDISINKIRICWDTPWNTKHVRSMECAYARAPFFAQYRDWLQETYAGTPEFLADFTIRLTQQIAAHLGIRHTQFLRASELPAIGRKTDRLLSILRHVEATHYLSGPSAKDYLEEEKLADAGIALDYMTYDYPEYPQPYPPFDPNVTVLDLLFMTGPEAGRYIWGPRSQGTDTHQINEAGCRQGALEQG